MNDSYKLYLHYHMLFTNFVYIVKLLLQYAHFSNGDLKHPSGDTIFTSAKHEVKMSVSRFCGIF